MIQNIHKTIGIFQIRRMYMVTVDGVEVRADEVNVQTEFQFLTEEGQKRLFLENKELFLSDALNSNYPAVRRLLWEPEVLESCSSDILNTAIAVWCMMGSEEGDLMTLINAVDSKLSKKNIELIACVPWMDIKLRVRMLQNEKISSKLLKVMFVDVAEDFVQSGRCILFDAIVKNPNFKWDEEMEQKIENFSPKGRKIIKERIEKLKN